MCITRERGRSAAIVQALQFLKYATHLDIISRMILDPLACAKNVCNRGDVRSAKFKFLQVACARGRTYVGSGLLQ